MNFEQLKTALLSRRAVIHRDVAQRETEYACVSAIIYRTNAEGKVFMQAELTDRTNLSRTIVDPERVYFKEEKQNNAE